jgi:gamma-polyglutamate synthase
MATNPKPAVPSLTSVLRTGLHPMLARALAPLLADLEAKLRGEGRSYESICADLSDRLLARHVKIGNLKGNLEVFSARISRTPDLSSRNSEILEFARVLGANPRDIRRDDKAFSRGFDFDAVAERCTKMIGQEERKIAFELGRLGKLSGVALTQTPSSWKNLGVESAVVRALHHSGDQRIRTAALICLKDALSVIPKGEREHHLGESAITAVLRFAFARDADVASQIAALEVLACVSENSFSLALRERLGKPGIGDDFWVRRAAIRMMCQGDGQLLDPELLRIALRDPSPSVRQALAGQLPHLSAQAKDCAQILFKDEANEVRAEVLVALPALSAILDVSDIIAILAQALLLDTAEIVVRVALYQAVEIARSIADQDSSDFYAAIMPQLDRLHVEATSLAVRRWAALAREQMWCQDDPRASALLRDIRTATGELSEGQAARMPSVAQALREDPDFVARVLAVLAQRDFGYQIEAASLGRAPRIRRGERFRFRAWRAWHEFRSSSPEKRQGHPHTLGRVYGSEIIAPSGIMAELAPTKVPGEPLHIAEEDGWRPYLPLPDLALSALERGSLVRIATSEGITEVAPPEGLLRRLRSRIIFSRRFADLSSLRNWSRTRSIGPNSYLATLQKLGFTVQIRGYGRDGTGRPLDPAVLRFFPAIAFPILPLDVWRRLEIYFFSLYQNTLLHLAVFLGAVGLYFVGRHALANQRIRRARRAVPLVIGGWGTRGKSGTERIKAAFLNGLGLSIVSKTTGNEAMILHGDAFGSLQELFLYRPYDKATIWEQADVLHIARDVKADVMLWECMALNPSYVTVLQRHWMRDDISTITNTYPDHEDIQGPAGRNIPEVMTKFIPKRGILLTSEEQMRPILAQSAQELETRLEGVGWLEAGLLPAEALARFPYEEHPYNIVLVLKLADELGVERDFALKEMADRVVPDLGVLKRYPVAEINGRHISFVMGMSANERFGAFSNWVRMGFDRHDPYAGPGEWITAVVNNRADRVPRSKVFAEFLVDDVALDRIVLIGSNLAGMRGYLNDAWERFEANLSLFSDRDSQSPAERLESAARRMRIAYRPEHLIARARFIWSQIGLPHDGVDPAVLFEETSLEQALDGVRPDLRRSVLGHVAEMRRTVREYEALVAALHAPEGQERAEGMFREAARGWFEAKLMVIEDFHATGDAVIAQLAEMTPPGFRNHVMGIQNIKGTGLDFVYKWQAWEQIARACEMAESDDPQLMAEGIQRLVAQKEFGIASENRVRSTLSNLIKRGDREPSLIAQVDFIERALDEQMARVRAEMTRDQRGRIGGRLISMLEAVLEPLDSMRRRYRAEQIYRDLATERISRPRAAYELKRITLRQKGGWLFSGRFGWKAR